MWFPAEFWHTAAVYPAQNAVTAQNWDTANQIAEQPLVSQSRGRATKSLCGPALLRLHALHTVHDSPQMYRAYCKDIPEGENKGSKSLATI